MGIKSIISSIAFVGAFAMSSGLAWLWQGPVAVPQPRCASQRLFLLTSTQMRLTRFLQEDIANGQTRQTELRAELQDSDDAVDFTTAYAKAVKNYNNTSALLDETNLPEDFQTAWQAHRTAWQQYGSCLRWQARAGDDKPLAISECDANDDINRTWMNVKMIARRYGAEIPAED